MKNLIKKSVYNFSLIERNSLMMTQFQNTSIWSITSNISKIRVYIDFCIREYPHIVPHNQNIFDTLTKDEAEAFINKQAINLKYITEEQLREYENILYNEQDKALMNLIYYGVRGRTEKGAKLEEIINLQITPHSKDVEEGKLLLERNDGTVIVHYVPQHTMSLVIDAYNQKEYVTDNGVYNPNFRGGNRVIPINRCENFCILQYWCG